MPMDSVVDTALVDIDEEDPEEIDRDDFYIHLVSSIYLTIASIIKRHQTHNPQHETVN